MTEEEKPALIHMVVSIVKIAMNVSKKSILVIREVPFASILNPTTSVSVYQDIKLSVMKRALETRYSGYSK